MKLTVNQLRRIIKEELEACLGEGGAPGTERINMTRDEFLASLSPEQRAAFDAMNATEKPARRPGMARVMLSPDDPELQQIRARLGNK